MDLEQKFKVKEEGDANFYRILSDKDWLCRIQMNGELTNKTQKEIVNLIVGCINFYFVIKKKIKEKFDNYDSTGNN